MDFLPISRQDLDKRGWDELDIIFVSGDAYVDHPSFAAAILGRFLESRGFKVGIIAQPDWNSLKDIRELGQPRLFFGVSAGNIDSMVSHYTADKKIRHEDLYSPGAKAGLRPNRTTIVYSNLIRRAYPGVPVIIGGVEASLRRLAHYDYWTDKVRRSILLDSKADLLVYGMGEHRLLEIANALKAGKEIKYMTNLRGTCYASKALANEMLEIPSFESISNNSGDFAKATQLIHDNLNPYNARTLAQRHGERWVVQNPPAFPLTTEEMDEIYDLDFKRQYHPSYEAAGGVPALKPVQFSLYTHRGCFGGCAFCSIGMHQGKFIQSRSQQSIVREARKIVEHPDFKGSIPDVGAASANMYGLNGMNSDNCHNCRRTSCLFPRVCKNMDVDQSPSVKLWRELRSIKGIKHIRVASGVRYDLLNQDSSGSYLEDLCRYHVGGQLKIAPEHVSDRVTKLMEKPGRSEYEKFVRNFKKTNKKLGKEQYIIPYFISAHPGSGLDDTVELAEFVRDNMQYSPEQVQNFTPTPMTISTCMYFSGLNPRTMKKVYVPKKDRERKWQRALLQYRNRDNQALAREALKECGRSDLIGSSPKALVRDITNRGSKNVKSKNPKKKSDRSRKRK